MSFLRQQLSSLSLAFALYKQQKRIKGSSIQSLLNPAWEKQLKEYSLIESNCDLKGNPSYLGRGLYIGNTTLIYNTESIGDFCSISSGVKIGLAAHPKHFLSTSPLFYSASRGLLQNSASFPNSQKKVVIGHDVLISANVLIMEGITIGTGSIIGAGAVVVKDVAPYSIVAGVPAKPIGMRFPDTIVQQLLESSWWNLPLDQILELPHLQDAARIPINRKN
ncbi:CatB-related O-acetyltransferase [Flavihumibacter sp. UBA7668]|uniref:CatB-related O-acetyltransferase n=1 Tax=Flavihumibacter sp. UBA7668 TaxID=1946542 RepID=UPI0025B9FC82|nr:CatB-related O-acetyltransferase [Flavihumibacter sp. UBA7668]